MKTMIDSGKKEIELEMIARMVASGFEHMEERFQKVDERFDGMESRLDGMDSRLDGVESRLDGMDSRFDGVDSRLANIETEQKETNRRLESLERKQMGTLESLDETVARREFDELENRVVKLEGKFA